MQKLNNFILPWPTDWTDLFGRSAPLILEIGFGTGTFLQHLATLNPDANLIGIEVSNQSLLKAERIIERKKFAHVRVIHSTGEAALQFLFEPATIQQVYINFPDPWFKKRHRGRRLMQRDTLNTLVNRLLLGADLFLATDIIAYAEMSAELLRDTPELDNQLRADWSDEPLPGRIVTKYEATARREGRDCYYFHYRRNDQPAPAAPIIREMDMPHIVFSSPLSLEDMQTQFEPITQVDDGGETIKVLECYRSARSLLFEVIVRETTIDQRIAFMLRRNPNSGDFTLLLGTLGHARVTPGVHRAASILGDWLLGLHPDAQPVKSKVGKTE
jgi:tRNA (guanine-N7-)-methyltransferase